jgi:hypothetical protein
VREATLRIGEVLEAVAKRETLGAIACATPDGMSACADRGSSRCLLHRLLR